MVSQTVAVAMVSVAILLDLRGSMAGTESPPMIVVPVIMVVTVVSVAVVVVSPGRRLASLGLWNRIFSR